MPEFCVKCFTALNDKGQCPVCDARAIAAAVTAASVVSNLPVTPVCDEEPTRQVPDAPVVPDEDLTQRVRQVPDAPVVPDEDLTQRVRQVPDAPVVHQPKFCMKCGGGLNEVGKCPVCDAPPAPPVLKFCMKCGGSLDETGKCPVCDAPSAPPVLKFCMKCGGSLDETGKCPVCDAASASMASLSEMAHTAVVVEEAPPTKKESKEKKAVSALSVIATVLLSICLFVTLLLSVSVLTVRTTVRKGGVAKVIAQLDVPQLLQSFGSAGDAEFDKLFGYFEDAYGIDMDREKLAELLEESTVPQYISDKAGEFTTDFFEGDAELVITREELVDLVADNENLIEKQMPMRQELTKEDHERIAGWMIKDGVDEISLVSTDQLQESVPVVYQTINVGFSWVAFALFLLLSALIGFVMCRNSLSQAAIGGGVVCILLGGAALLAASLSWIPGLWTGLFGSNPVLNVVGAVLASNGWIFAAVLLVGILLLVTRTVVKHVLAKKA